MSYDLALGSTENGCREEWFNAVLQACSELGNITEPGLPFDST